MGALAGGLLVAVESLRRRGTRGFGSGPARMAAVFAALVGLCVLVMVGVFVLMLVESM